MNIVSTTRGKIRKAVFALYLAGFYIGIIVMLIGCSTTLDVLADLHTPDYVYYDQSICEHGPASPPGVTPRPGCVNDKTKTRNYSDFDKYLNTLDEYNQQQ